LKSLAVAGPPFGTCPVTALIRTYDQVGIVSSSIVPDSFSKWPFSFQSASRGDQGFQLGEAGGQVLNFHLLPRDGALLLLVRSPLLLYELPLLLDFVEQHGASTKW
jgi:hypothetical protein